MTMLAVPQLDTWYPDWYRSVPRITLSEVPWAAAYPYHPVVTVGLAHDRSHLLLHFRVREERIRAHTVQNNGEVWKDSCVECFIAPMGDLHYYNFEFNCVGALRVSTGTERKGRRPAPLEILERVRVATSLEKAIFEEKSGGFEWELSAVIPVETFFEHHLSSLEGLTARANFYKCGDDLSVPHFLAWQPILTPQPDFHRPEFFGGLFFQ